MFIVVLTSACPSSSCTSFGAAPLESRLLVNVCLGIWKWKSSNPSSFFFADLVITPTVLGDSYAPSDLRQTKDISLYPSGTSSVLGMHRRVTCLAVLHRQIWLKTNGKNYVLKYITLRILSFLFKKWYTEQSNSKGGELTQWDLFEVTTRCSCKSGNRLYRAYFMMLSVGCAYNWCKKKKYSK